MAASGDRTELPASTKSLTALGYVLIEDARFGEAVAPLAEALAAAQDLPEYARGIFATIVDLLRRAFTGDRAAVTAQFPAITGHDVPAWMTEPADPSGWRHAWQPPLLPGRIVSR